ASRSRRKSSGSGTPPAVLLAGGAVLGCVLVGGLVLVLSRGGSETPPAPVSPGASVASVASSTPEAPATTEPPAATAAPPASTAAVEPTTPDEPPREPTPPVA